MRVLEDKVFTSIGEVGSDGLCVVSEDIELRRCVFDFRDVPISEQDEVISLVKGARMKMRGCVILGGIKAILAGNGDYPEADAARGYLDMEDCLIIGSGRRCPEAQDGVQVSMVRCWVHDWGQIFDVRAFGAWAHRGACIRASQCLFTQSGGLLSLGLKNTIIDIANHIGQAVNDYGLRALFKLKSWIPGVRRGLTADTGGTIRAVNCYTNKRWIILEGCLTRCKYGEASRIAHMIEEACPDMHEYMGMSITDLATEYCTPWG